MSTIVRPVALVAMLVAIVACSPASGGLGSVPPVASPSPPASIPPDLTPAPASPTPDPTGSPSPGSPTPAPTARPDTIVVRAYFHLDGPRGSAGLVPVLREVPQTVAVGRVALEHLLAGPVERERTASPAISTSIPAGTRLLGLDIANGIATVDLSREFESGGGSASVLGRLGQVVYTLTQFPTVRAVSFEIEGRPVTVFSGEGVVLDGPVGRDSFEDQLPIIFVDRPAWGAALGNPGRVTGSANTFEAMLQVTLLDAADRVLVDVPVMATSGSGTRGTFEVALEYRVDEAQWGTLRVWEASARDGEPVNVREYPVWLTPAG